MGQRAEKQRVIAPPSIVAQRMGHATHIANGTIRATVQFVNHEWARIAAS
jgi:hypothetical protein